MATEKEQKLAEFKERIKDVKRPCHEDSDLKKWLTARTYDVKEAEKMYRAHISWRRVFKADIILESFQVPEVISKYYPGGNCGYDSEGRPISVDPFGRLDLRVQNVPGRFTTLAVSKQPDNLSGHFKTSLGFKTAWPFQNLSDKSMLKSATSDEILHAMAWRFEMLDVEFKRLSAQHGRPINQVTQILDFEGFGRHMLYLPGGQLVINILKMNDSNYPETLYKSYIVNTPYIFQLGYGFIKRFLSEDTKKKFCFLGSNWKKELREAIGTDQYPAHWGGALTDPDGNIYCQSKICLGGPIPETYYRDDLKEEKEVDLKTAQVKSGDVFKVEKKVEETSILQWYFISEGKDIEFAVMYKPDSGKEEVVEAMKTVKANQIPESGSCLCDKPGTYILIFDNTKSWVTTKTVKYNVEVISENTEDISVNL